MEYKKVLIIECKSQEIADSYLEDLAHNEIELITIVDKSLEVDEVVKELPGMYLISDIELLKKQLKDEKRN